MRKWVLAGSTIITDFWGGPYYLSQHGYNHLRVNHEENFVDPNNPNIHTQTVEGANKHLRLALPPFGLKGHHTNYGWWIAGRHMYKRFLKHHPALKADGPEKSLLKHLAAWSRAGEPIVELRLNMP